MTLGVLPCISGRGKLVQWPAPQCGADLPGFFLRSGFPERMGGFRPRRVLAKEDFGVWLRLLRPQPFGFLAKPELRSNSSQGPEPQAEGSKTPGSREVVLRRRCKGSVLHGCQYSNNAWLSGSSWVSDRGVVVF